jgi:4-amino-4-deoxy-L-arabinose transferase-like glycosyltransferase
MKKKYIILIIVLIFIISVAVRYWPIYHKGFSFSFESDNLILARNLALTGEYKIDNEKNVILSSEIIKENGIVSAIGNKLTPILYAEIFKIFGFDKNLPLYVSLVLYGIVTALFFLIVLKLFNIWVALIFVFIDIFSPLVMQYAIRFGTYEWAVLFLAIALLIYLWKEKPGIFKLIISGLFLALASLARNSFLILPFAFLVYDFIKNKSFKRVIIFILPVMVLWGIFLFPNVIEGGTINNAYLSPQEITRDYMHIFPDPYTWHFERDAYIKEVTGTTNYTYSEILNYYGYPVSFKNKVLMYWASIVSYPKGLFAQTTIGGPFLVFFLILGGIYLYEKKKDLLKLFVLWGGFLYLLLIINKSNHWGHFLSLQFPIFLMISLGVYWLIQFLRKQDWKNYYKYLLIFGIILVLFIHLIQSDKWMFHERYLYSGAEDTLKLVKVIEGQKDEIDKKNDVIAVGSPNSNAPAIINWYTDFSCVYFDPETVKKLLEKSKLQWAFEQFGITKIIGYDQDLTEEVIKATNADVI